MGLLADILYTNKVGRLAIKGMDTHAQKALLITGHIANAETPGYKAVKIKPFEQALKNAFRSTIKMSSTNAKHMEAGGTLASFKPEITVSKDPGKLDGNNVNLDLEMAEMAQNTMMYQAIITASKKRGAIISSAVGDNK